MEGDRKSVRKPRAKTRTHDFTDKNRGVRLQKALADAGVAARRECEELVLSGAVTVNGHTVDTLPAWVDPATDRVEVYGRPLRRSEQHVYVVLFKPRGTVCTNSDPEGRPRAIDLVQHPSRARLYCVGRLDLDTSGLLILTNDGEFANRLTHPRYEVPKGYDLTLDGSLGEAEIARIEREIFRRDRAGGDTGGTSSLRLINRESDKTVVHLELCEHRNLQIRPLMLELGHPVKKLRRTSFGPLRLKGLAVGEWRDLTPKEIEILRSASRGKGGGRALSPKSPKRSMEDFAAAREARAATAEAPGSATTSMSAQAPKSSKTAAAAKSAPAAKIPFPARAPAKAQSVAQPKTGANVKGKAPTKVGAKVAAKVAARDAARAPDRRASEWSGDRSRAPDRRGGDASRARGFSGGRASEAVRGSSQDRGASGARGPSGPRGASSARGTERNSARATDRRGSDARGPSARGPSARGPSARGPSARGPSGRGPNGRGPDARGPKGRGPKGRGR